jgi:integrase-like protein
MTGDGKYVFPSEIPFEQPMSDNALNAALRHFGSQSHHITPHGFRAMASTILNEQGWIHDAIERRLAHIEHNKMHAAYNYADTLVERRKMLQVWAEHLVMLFQTAQTPQAVRSEKGNRPATSKHEPHRGPPLGNAQEVVVLSNAPVCFPRWTWRLS